MASSKLMLALLVFGLLLVVAVAQDSGEQPQQQEQQIQQQGQEDIQQVQEQTDKQEQQSNGNENQKQEESQESQEQLRQQQDQETPLSQQSRQNLQQPQNQQEGHQHHTHQIYNIGDVVTMECRQQDATWGPGPTCMETKKELQLVFGMDGMYRCTWAVDDEFYALLITLIQRKASWNCRMSMSHDDHSFKIPFAIPIWGVVEDSHIHVDNHMNFVFHVDHGWIIGVTAYPLRDDFQETKKSGAIGMHGEVRWFRQHTFESLLHPVGLPSALRSTPLFWIALFISFMAMLFVCMVFIFAYLLCLKPRIVRRLQEQQQVHQQQSAPSK